MQPLFHCVKHLPPINKSKRHLLTHAHTVHADSHTVAPARTCSHTSNSIFQCTRDPSHISICKIIVALLAGRNNGSECFICSESQRSLHCAMMKSEANAGRGTMSSLNGFPPKPRGVIISTAATSEKQRNRT